VTLAAATHDLADRDPARHRHRRGLGVVRDLLLRDVPEILGGRRLYATSAAAASIVLVVCHQLGQAALGVVGAIVVGAGLRLLSYHRGWSLPRKAP
jgi:uncharacterized membrane protein YeiH